MLKQQSFVEGTRSNRHFDDDDHIRNKSHKKQPEDRTSLKRRVSCDIKTLKKTDSDSTPRRKTKELEVKLNYKLSSDVISFEMDEQRTQHMKVI